MAKATIKALFRGDKLHFKASSLSHISCYILIGTLPEAHAERNKYLQVTGIALDTSFPLSTRLQHCLHLCCPTDQVFHQKPSASETFDLKECDLAAGIFFSFSQSNMNRKATLHLTTMAFHLSQGCTVNEG